MGISQKTFTEIKDILQKLDRSIDDVRESRRRDRSADPASSNGSTRGANPGAEKNPQYKDRAARPKQDNPHERRIG